MVDVKVDRNKVRVIGTEFGAYLVEWWHSDNPDGATICLSEMYTKFARSEHPATWGCAVTYARDLARAECRAEFISHPQWPDTLIPASGKQRLAKGIRFHEYSKKKQKRGIAIVSAVKPVNEKEARHQERLLQRMNAHALALEIEERRKKNAPPGLD